MSFITHAAAHALTLRLLERAIFTATSLVLQGKGGAVMEVDASITLPKRPLPAEKQRLFSLSLSDWQKEEIHA